MKKENLISKLNEINILKRYKELSEKYSKKKESITFDEDKFIVFLKYLEPNFNKNKKEKFYGLKEQMDHFEFRFNIDIKFGVVESIIWSKDLNTDNHFGGPLNRIIKQIQKLNNETPTTIKYPSYSSNECLKEIILVLYHIYEDFKKIILINGIK